VEDINKVREAIISGATAGRKGFSDKSRDKSSSGTNEESLRTLSRWQTGWRARATMARSFAGGSKFKDVVAARKESRGIARRKLTRDRACWKNAKIMQPAEERTIAPW